ncbi:signal recognition particle-docking protein FtsY [Candidatus Venteria ishoeyi]|uniref:Signal recognition particle receptor FtsY n=1 Tax=Candidatus Venteria ishoeyi TaxID=1899563 RepID=A0A1H6FAE8_9GAMM|nr:signal recognition particle-docking protein FtsY [Candidatus Venteria ishoeyi]MDM8545269.1 signal recognition particle-docking protein FtsY [Candidatus Venteria ishoeyi]SEH05592.1 Signal recognition particle receptor FtsY [Candidatus Venteria ishoeyi]SEH07067.1 Signal recognition particle receptor FtsY [Candidatus Venteria ishoeyi]
MSDTENTEQKGLFSRLKNTLTGNNKDTQADSETVIEPRDKPSQNGGFFARLKQGLNRTRTGLTKGLARLGIGKTGIDDELLEDIETLLLMADVGVEATREIISDLEKRVSHAQLEDLDMLFQALQEDMQKLLGPVEQPLVIPENTGKPFVLLMIGMNGAGKTTTIGKLAKRFQGEGKSVMLAAGDTFRAAAVEQLKVWGQRNDVPVVAQKTGSDSASVIYDALQSATAKGVDVLIADTAGRLHTQDNLMSELEKVQRVMGKIDAEAPHETMIIVDASIGQNALNQVEQFHQAVGLSGISVTKLDGTAKGGILFAIAKKTGLPIRYIGIGEGIDDLRVFHAGEFVEALLSREED